ncbi:MAG: hypothetical protein JWN76_2809 [Chitinophagaceae bacterium]|nr:hypothetical protein [Chitinophagaceae bacterium]
MKSETYGARFLQRRRFFTILPAIVIPFVTTVFWLMGGGTNAANGTTEITGLNLQLPDATPKKEVPVSKLSFYEAAEADSFKKQQELKDDPYINSMKEATVPEPKTAASVLRQARRNRIDYKEMEGEALSPEKTQPVVTKEVDPELEELSQMLDKIKAIQQPQSVNTIRNKKIGLSLPVVVEETDNSFFGKHSAGTKRKAFLSEGENQANMTVTAVIEQSQKLQEGSVIKMRILSDFYIQNILLPAGTPLFGIASIDHERMKIEVPSIRKDNQLFPVSLSVYDIDGLQGIYVPGSVTRNVAKQSAGEGLQSLDIAGMDPSFKGQLLHTGIGAVKSLFSNKVKQLSVTVPAGYRVLLHDDGKENE